MIFLDRVVVDDTDLHDLGWTLAEPEVPIPEPKTSFVDVPGGDGRLDLSEAVTGHVVFDQRVLVLPMWKACATRYAARQAISELAALIDGKQGRFYLVGAPPNDTGPKGWYYGRVTQMEPSLHGSVAQVEVEVTCDPFLYTGTSVQQLPAGETETASGGIAHVTGGDGISAIHVWRPEEAAFSVDGKRQHTMTRAWAWVARTRNLLDLDACYVTGSMFDGSDYNQAPELNGKGWNRGYQSHVLSVGDGTIHVNVDHNKVSTAMDRITETYIAAMPGVTDYYGSGVATDTAYYNAIDDYREGYEGEPAFNGFTVAGRAQIVVEVQGTLMKWSEKDPDPYATKGVSILWEKTDYHSLGHSEMSTPVWEEGDGTGKVNAKVTCPQSGCNLIVIQTAGCSCDLYVRVYAVPTGTSSPTYTAPDITVLKCTTSNVCWLHRSDSDNADEVVFSAPSYVMRSRTTHTGSDPHDNIITRSPEKSKTLSAEADALRLLDEVPSAGIWVAAAPVSGSTPYSLPLEVAQAITFSYRKMTINPGLLPVTPTVTSTGTTIFIDPSDGTRIVTRAGTNQLLPLTLGPGPTEIEYALLSGTAALSWEGGTL